MEAFGIRVQVCPDPARSTVDGFVLAPAERAVVATWVRTDGLWHEKLADPAAPVWSSVHLTNVEALGCGTLAYDRDKNQVLPHVHVAVGLKEHSATAHANHLLSARVQFLTEMMLIEITAPQMSRIPDRTLYDVPLLGFGSEN